MIDVRLSHEDGLGSGKQDETAQETASHVTSQASTGIVVRPTPSYTNSNCDV